VECLEYLHNKEKIVHRDLKLENIMLDGNYDLKIVDFGGSSAQQDHNISSLTSYTGTQSYMAPEIREGKVYCGTQVDLFSVGVILFILAQSRFPFQTSSTSNYYYGLLISGKTEEYFSELDPENNLTDDFK
jgi:serine/threonine protein kinase